MVRPMAHDSPLVDAIAAGCAAAGFDLCAATTAAAYHAVAPDHRVDDFGRPRALVIVVGNTRALWPAFARALADDALARAAHPLDTYARRAIAGVVAGALEPAVRRDVYLAPEPPPRRVALQRLADVAGLAARTASGLCVHPVYGPWIALRAAIVIDIDGHEAAPIAPPCDCATGCGPAMARAQAAGPPRDAVELRARWRLWLAVRDACPVGRDHRYGDDQLAYHYTGDRTYLPRATQSSASTRS